MANPLLFVYLRHVARDGPDDRLDVLVPLGHTEVKLKGFTHPATQPKSKPNVLAAALPRIALKREATWGK